MTVNGILAFPVTLSSTQMLVSVDPSSTQTPGLVPIVISNGPPGGGSVSGTVTVTVSAPTITSLNPASVTVSSHIGFYLTINGTGFYNATQATWNGQPLSLYNLSGTQVTAFIPSDLFAVPQTARITVTNPGPPGQGGSATATLPVLSQP